MRQSEYRTTLQNIHGYTGTENAYFHPGYWATGEKAPLIEGQEIIFAEKDADYDPSRVVIGCDEQGVVSQVNPNDRVLFDDGLIKAQVLNNENEWPC